MCIGVVTVCVNRIYYWRCGQTINPVFESSNRKSGEILIFINRQNKKFNLSILGFQYAYQNPKSTIFQALTQTLLRSNFLKKTISRDLLTQKLPPNDFRCKNIFLGGQSHYALFEKFRTDPDQYRECLRNPGLTRTRTKFIVQNPDLF